MGGVVPLEKSVNASSLQPLTKAVSQIPPLLIYFAVMGKRKKPHAHPNRLIKHQ